MNPALILLGILALFAFGDEEKEKQPAKDMPLDTEANPVPESPPNPPEPGTEIVPDNLSEENSP